MKTAEDEEFERIERENNRNQEAFKATPSREQLMAEVTVLTELVRVLNDRVNELEREQAMREVQRLGQEIEKEPVACTLGGIECPVCRKSGYPYPKCRCVTYEEKNND